MPEKPGLNPVLGLLWTKGWIEDLLKPHPTWKNLHPAWPLCCKGLELCSAHHFKYGPIFLL